jgi:glycosyltransferase involved in cell wall biosynthesis
VAAKQQLLATIKKLGLYSVAKAVVADRNLRQLPLVLKPSNSGNASLIELAYGPNHSKKQRKAAIEALLELARESKNSEQLAVLENHLSAFAGSGPRQRSVVVETYREFIRTGNTTQTQLIYARANFGLTLPDALFGAEAKRKLQISWLNSLLELHGLATLDFDSKVKPLTIDDLPDLFGPVPQKALGPKVTVLLPVFNGEEFIHTALAGLAAQSYRNIEVLVIDDASTDGTRELVKKFAASDKRFRLIQVKVNGGSYRARNIGLEEAMGEFVTVHDADDWSHPQKLELQVAPLIAQPKLMATLSRGIRVAHESLRFLTVANGLYIRQNISSLMFRREPTQAAIGYWDEVLFGGDSEFHERLEAQFGASSVKLVSAGPLSFTRFLASSLTGGGYASTQSGITGIRRFYVDSYNFWHEQIKAGRLSPKIGRASAGRPFAAPPLQHDRKAKYAKFELVLVADLTSSKQNEAAAVLKQVAGLKRVGLLNLSAAGERLNPAILSAVDFEKVSLLLPGDIATAKVVRILNSAALGHVPKVMAELTADTVEFVNEEAARVEHRATAKKLFGGAEK